jgi:uncharacterized protein YjaZ
MNTGRVITQQEAFRKQARNADGKRVVPRKPEPTTDEQQLTALQDIAVKLDKLNSVNNNRELQQVVTELRQQTLSVIEIVQAQQNAMKAMMQHTNSAGMKITVTERDSQHRIQSVLIMPLIT